MDTVRKQIEPAGKRKVGVFQFVTSQQVALMRDTGIVLYDNISMALKIRHKYTSMIRTNTHTHTQNTGRVIMGVSSDKMAKIKRYLTLFGLMYVIY